MANFSRPHICHCLTRFSTLRRNSALFVSGHRRKTGLEFVESVLSLARGLLRLGLRAGDIVAICAFNSDWYLEWILAVAYVGGIVATLNYRWCFEEAKSALLTVNPVMLVWDDSCNNWHSELQSNAIPSLRWQVFLGSSFSSSKKNMTFLASEVLREHGSGSLPSNYSWAPEGTVIICFTSGTTGRPKGVTISHSALIVQSLAKVAIVGYSENDVYLHTAPLCHIGGLSSAMAMLMVGACHVFIPKFEATLAVEAIEQHCVTSFITVPAIMADLIALIRVKENWKGRQCVKKILNGGGNLSVELIKETAKFFSRAKLLSAYGMTETCSSLTFLTLCDATLETNGQYLQTVGQTNSNLVREPQGICVGKPAPHVELKIDANGSYNVGRILTRGPHLMLHYWHPGEAKAVDPTDEVWFDTGDVGSIDVSGNVWLVGRTNGRIKSGGENVYPEEVEAILLQHPGVIAVVVVGIPDAHLTEMVVACIKLRENWKWSNNNRNPFARNELILCSETLRNYCKEKNLTRFKAPKLFLLWRKPFPLTSTGKIKRDQVRHEAVSHLQSLHSNL